MTNDRLDKLINQCKSNDVDLKVDAVTKLQTEFESGTEITDPEPLLAVLKSCLRISNQHLTTATLSAIPPLLSVLVPRPTTAPHTNAQLLSASSSSSSSSFASASDISTLRQIMNAFLPSPGVFERLGDTRERAREKARETLVIVGGLAFRFTPSASKLGAGKGPETPLAMFERLLRDSGFNSKVWRVREQSILVLVNIRRAHSMFPIRPYLPLLVDALEDTDGNVRACATPSVIELFTSSGVTDAARADLKKEMTKKNTRKTIVDNVLAKLMSGNRSTGACTPQSDGSENGELGVKREYIPPSLMLQNRRPTVGSTSGGPPAAPTTRAVSHGNINPKELSRPASRAAMVVSPPLPQPSNETASAVEPAFIASSRDLENEFAAMAKAFEGKETEHNWAARDRGIQRVRGMLKGDIHIRYPHVFLQCLKDGFIQSSLKTLASLRTTVSANTCSLYAELATALGTGIDPFCDMLFSNLLRMAGFTKKIIAQQSQQSLSMIIQHASAHPRMLLPSLWSTLQEKTVQSRTFVVSHIKQYLEVHGQRSKSHIESVGGLEILERSLKKALVDANPAVRENARNVFWVFDGVWHDSATAILESLEATARKQLEKACPDPHAMTHLLPITPNAKKSSVAAAIAASRAKAKAIATAPPTLRHQATSASRAAGATSPPTKRVSSPSSPSAKAANGRSSPSPTSRASLSPRSSLSPPTPPRSRILANNGTMPRSVSTSATMLSHSRTPSDSLPTSPTDATRRRTSSPLVQPIQSPSRGSAPRSSQQPVGPPSPSQSELSHKLHPQSVVPVPARRDTVIPDVNEEESLLLAATIPVPDDSDSDMDESVNLMSFSTPYKMYPPAQSITSQQPSPSPQSVLLTPNTVLNTLPDSPEKLLVEDALRARAEQAQSTAERLLELNDSEEEDSHHSTVAASLLLGSSTSTPKPNISVVPVITKSLAPPVTPDNRNAAIFRLAAQFKNSPINGAKPADPLIKPLRDQTHENGWWLKRANAVDHGTPLKGVQVEDRLQELHDFISALENGDANVRALQKLALLCSNNPIPNDTASPLSPGLGLPLSPSPFISTTRNLPPLIPDMWTKSKSFERLFDGLVKFLEPTKDSQLLEYALIVVWEILGNQAALLEGREAELFAALFRVRYCNAIEVLEATKTIRDALTMRVEPVYGLTTMHSSLRAFISEPALDPIVKAGSHAFGLIALGKFILRLPAEVLEEELPRLKHTFISALNDTSTLVIREAAYAAIIASQLVLRDEGHLFALLEGLDDNKKNLLTYYFEKHGARELDFTTGSAGTAGMTKLEGQMGRLDKLMNTPQRGQRRSE
ncbi:clasp N terminal-domain-containing protein [Phlebopus sp. FC_14]|nr:clasp N terminal-domain-containing protein [Phlebopus sp. FC_14]